MALYIKPPSGYATLNKLHNFVMKRLILLYHVYTHSVEDIAKIIGSEALAENSDCLIEGTVKDKISHFTLRLLCVPNNILYDFFMQSEIKLFDYRLKFCDFSKLRYLLQKASKQSQYILLSECYLLKSYEDALKSVIHVAEEVEFAFKYGCHSIKIHFTSAIQLITQRVYPLHMGYINLPLGDLKILLQYLFEKTIFEGMNQMKSSQCMKELNNSQMLDMHHKIKAWLISKLSILRNLNCQKFINGNSVEHESVKFPLCMINLHKQLSKHHRLKHLSRVQYTLFLKEIGVPCSDVIKLFMKEYSIPIHSCNASYSRCSHTWADSEKRYIYNIEHLYGMRGACKNYKAHNCLSLQSTYDSEGGCPFVTFDEQHLQETLTNQYFEVKDIEDISSFMCNREYQKACNFYLRCKAKMYNTTKNLSLNHCVDKNLKCKLSSNFQNSSTIYFDSAFKEQNQNQKHNSILNLPLKISSPSEFYSIFSSYVNR